MTIPKPPLDTVEGGEAFRDVVFEGAKRMLESRGCLRPQCIVVARRDPETGTRFESPVIMPLGLFGDDGPEGRNAFAHVIATWAIASDALAAALIIEAWHVRASGEREVYALRRWVADHGGSVADHPLKIEVVQVTWEHALIGLEYWQAPIERTGDAVTLGPFERLTAAASGRLAQLLPPASYGPEGVQA